MWGRGFRERKEVKYFWEILFCVVGITYNGEKGNYEEEVRRLRR